jgi:hypothetical protein
VVKNKKKLDKKQEDALMYFLIPLIQNENTLPDKKGWSEFRESLEATFAPIVGSWKDKKGEKRYNTALGSAFSPLQRSREIF